MLLWGSLFPVVKIGFKAYNVVTVADILYFAGVRFLICGLIIMLYSYDFDKKSGNIEYTGRCINVPGVDGLTVDKNDNLYVACWGQGHIAVVNTKTMEITDYIKTPAKIPVSCCFCGKDMNILAVVTASYGCNDENAGQTFATRRSIGGRLPYLFGGKY